MYLRHLIFFCIAFVYSIQAQSQTCITGGTPGNQIIMGNQTNLTISGKRIYNLSGNPNSTCIYLFDCNNVRIENCVLGPSRSEGIKLINCTNVTIVNCYFIDNSSGVVAEGGSGIKVLNNQFLNAQGPFPRGQCVQFLQVTGAGNEISYNVSEQVEGNSRTEDLINLYKSHGTAASPILVKGNKLRGGTLSQSSGGILSGDVGGSYQRIEDNILVDPGQYGIAIATGQHNQLINNKVYGYGTPRQYANTPYYAYNYYLSSGYTCSDLTVTGNESNYMNANGQIGGIYLGNPTENNTCGPVAGISNNNFNATFGPEILPARLLCPLLVAHYPLNNNYQDASGSGHHVSTNVAFSTEGKDISCGNFSGSTYLPLPNSPWLHITSNRITVSAWIKPANTQGIKAIATAPDSDGYTDGWRLILNDGTLNGRVTTTLGSMDAYVGGIQAGIWSLVTMTYDGKQLKLYVNGVLSATANHGGTMAYGNYSAQMLVGYSRGTNYYFNGQMDEFKFYNGDLTQAEILQAYNEDKDQFAFPRQLLAYYKFNGSWNDASGNNLTATSNGVGFGCDGADAVSANFNGGSLLSLPINNMLRLSTSKFYLSCWIKPTVVQGIQGISRSQDADGYNTGWRLLLLDNTLNGRIVTNWGAVDVYCGGIQAGAWNHVALMYDGTALKVFLNGQLQASTATGGYIHYASGPSQNMLIGYSNGNNYYFNGRIDEYRFYNGVVSQQEVLAEYNTTRASIDNQPPCPLRIMVQETPAPKGTKAVTPHFNIYPNPAVAELFISAGTSFQAILYDATGKRIWQGSDQAGNLRLDTKPFQPGVYFLQVSGKGFQESRKVLIQR
jgi:parallel beta-helix repeat protein